MDKEQFKAYVPTIVRAGALVGATATAYWAGYVVGKRNATVTVIQSITPVQSVDTPDEEASEEEEYQTPTLVLTKEQYEEHDRLLSSYTEQQSLAETKENVFSGPEREPEDDPIVVDSWNYDRELGSRSADEPYVIHEDEYAQDELGFSHSSLTYYAGDDVLTDSSDNPINSYERITGKISGLFGHGSSDPDTVYIRNHKFSSEYEIVRNMESYAKEILGIMAEDAVDGELMHSARRTRLE